METHAALLFSLLLASASLFLHADSKQLPAERSHHKEQPNNKIPDELWEYVNVRTNAYMFWWLYGCMNSSLIREDRPLVMWLQGGPGGSSTGFGNFLEIGPLDVNLQPRNTTWVQTANVLFVDNPVGTGYSYVTEDSAYTTDVDQIAADLITLFTAFLKKVPIFEKLPFYIFSESYGGKMASAFALSLQKAIAAGKINADFRGVALGDSWISPIDSVLSWGPYLLVTSQINQVELIRVDTVANKTAQALKEGKYTEATDLWGEAESIIEELTDNVNFYNILQHNIPEEVSLSKLRGWERVRHLILSKLHQASLSALMNGPIRKKLGIIPSNVTWGGQSAMVFEKQVVDFMKDVISTVDELLDMGVNVTVYSGQLDLIVDVLGTLTWIDKLTWSGLQKFHEARRVPLYPPSAVASRNTGAFLQSYKNLAFYWILKAGHMVPSDAGDMALMMLRMVIGG